ncbi:hypothetical protein [uncultured Bacteroides sp.]|uniref:hypothetical protein n=1 Tax=uncultured Bacteroides sp. TaxID=162156 RepID=UPI00261FAB4E|nr:hypothetical protein [uncultured Bacteroides sp.]
MTNDEKSFEIEQVGKRKFSDLLSFSFHSHRRTRPSGRPGGRPKLGQRSNLSLAGRLAQYLAGRLAQCLASRLAQYLAGRLAQYLASGLAQYLAGRLAQYLAGRLAQYLAGRLAQCLAGRLAQCLAGRLAQDRMRRGLQRTSSTCVRLVIRRHTKTGDVPSMREAHPPHREFR